jgi:hypothetical protein
MGIGHRHFFALLVHSILGSDVNAPAAAHAAGSPRTLIGADLLDLRAPIAAIGGAGTFDGIFPSGVLAVLLARGARGTALRSQSRLPRSTSDATLK